MNKLKIFGLPLIFACLLFTLPSAFAISPNGQIFTVTIQGTVTIPGQPDPVPFSVHAVLTPPLVIVNHFPDVGSIRIEIPGAPAIGVISNGGVGTSDFFLTGTFNSGNSIFAGQTFLIQSEFGIPNLFQVNGVPLTGLELTVFQITNH